MKIEGQSVSNPKWKCVIYIHEVQANHFVGFVFGIIESGAVHPPAPFVETTREEAINKCKAWVNQVIPNCKFSA
jgi:hypothetical protein